MTEQYGTPRVDVPVVVAAVAAVVIPAAGWCTLGVWLITRAG